MEKIKSALTGHKKADDAVTDAPATSSTASTTNTSHQHPIFDEMTGQKSDPLHSTASTAPHSGPSPTATSTSAHPATGTHEPLSSEKQSNSLNPASAPSSRPGTLPEGLSEASIKSGVIGFGPTESGHAALPQRAAIDSDLHAKQILGGGDPAASTFTSDKFGAPAANATSGATTQAAPSAAAQPHSDITSSERPLESTAGSTVHGTTASQPLEKKVHTEDPSTDADRSFPLAGGVASKHATEPSTSINPTTTHELETAKAAPATEPTTGATHASTHKEAAPAAAAATAAAPVAAASSKHHEEKAVPAEEKPKQSLPEKLSSVIGGILPSKKHDEPTSAKHDTKHDTAIHEKTPATSGATSTQPASTSKSDSHHGTSAVAGAVPSSHTAGATSTYPTSITTPASVADRDAALTAGAVPTSHTTGTTSTLPKTSNEREPGTKEKEVGVHDGHGREALAGAAAAATAVGVAGHAHHKEAPTSGTSAPSTQAAAAPETASTPHFSSTPQTSSLPQTSSVPSASAIPSSTTQTSSNVPPSGTSATAGTHAPVVTGDTSRSMRQDVNPAALAAATAAAAKTAGTSSSTQSHTTPQTGVPADSSRTAAQSALGTTSHKEPHQHVPGEFPSPTPDESRTFLDYRSNIDTSGTTGIPTSEHELRHTGTLEQPSSKTAEPHHGKNTAVAGGLGAGAAGLGALAVSHHKEQPTTSGSTLPSEPSPYSSSKLDPRVDSRPTTADQTAPAAPTTTESAPHHALQTSNPAGISGSTSTNEATLAAPTKSASSTVPLTQSDSTHPTGTATPSAASHQADLAAIAGLASSAPTTQSENSRSAPTEPSSSASHVQPEHHHARDAALIGGAGATGAALAGAARPSASRNDTPGTGTYVLPERQVAPTSAAPSNTPATAQQSSTSSALPSSTTATTQPTSSPSTLPTPTGATTQSSVPPTTSALHGTKGAPAPIEDTNSSSQPTTTTQPSSSAAPVTKDTEDKHHGRDAALVGAGAATAGGLAYASQHDKKHDTSSAKTAAAPSTSNTGGVSSVPIATESSKPSHGPTTTKSEKPASEGHPPHSSKILNILDPRVKSHSEKQTSTPSDAHHSSGSRTDPSVNEKVVEKDQHHSREGALAGGAGLTGAGAYEAAKSYGDHPSTQPAASLQSQRYDTTAPGAHAPNPTPQTAEYDASKNDHTTRNAALGTGAALGAGSAAAAYHHSKDAEEKKAAPAIQPSSAATAYPAPATQSQAAPTGVASSTQPTAQSGATSATQPTSGTAAGHQRYDSILDPQQHNKHEKRDAAVAGAAGAATAGGAAYAVDQQQEKKEQKQLEKEAEKQEKEQHKLEKKQHQQEKAAEKEAHKQEKEEQKHHKAVAAEIAAEKKEAKKLEKEQHKEEKAAEKEAKRQEKEQIKEEKAAEKETKKLEKEEDKEKKGGLLGFLHRDKSKKEKHSPDASPRQSYEEPGHSKEYAAAGTTAAAAGTAGVVAHEASHPDSTTADDEHSKWKGKNLLHKDPPAGHPAREAQEHPERFQSAPLTNKQHQHIGIDGPIGDAKATTGDAPLRTGHYSAHDPTAPTEKHIITEPHTGIPMNTALGSGAGGTDASPTIHGAAGVTDVKSSHPTTGGAIPKTAAAEPVGHGSGGVTGVHGTTTAGLTDAQERESAGQYGVRKDGVPRSAAQNL